MTAVRPSLFNKRGVGIIKVCKTCGIEKDLNCFYTAKSCKDGHRGECKTCRDKWSKKYNKANVEKVTEYKKKYYEDNIEKITTRSKKHYENNSEKAIVWGKEYRKTNAEKISTRTRKYQKNRRNTDPAFKLLHNLRKRLWDAVKGNVKSARTMELVGCTIENLQKHLEHQFTEGMSWENQGKWHVDHIVPCASFDLSKEENQRECFNYKNLQPLWAEDNWRKSNKIDFMEINHETLNQQKRNSGR